MRIGAWIVAPCLLVAACRDGAAPVPVAGSRALAPLSHPVIVSPLQPAAPRFEDYPVAPEQMFRGRPATVDLASDPDARRFRTRYREDTATGPHFAGHLAVVQWGCGTNCHITHFVDVRSGRIADQTVFTGVGTSYRLDSRLFICDPPENRCDGGTCDHTSCGRTGYYVWDGDRLIPLGDWAHDHAWPR